MDEEKRGWFGHDENEILKQIAKTLKAFEEDFDEFLALVRKFVQPQPVRATLTYATQQGETTDMATTPLALFVGQTAVPTFSEFDANGIVVPVVGPVTYAADTSGAISVDPNTGIVTGVNETPPNGTTAGVIATDANNGLTASASFTVSAVVPPPATSATLTYAANPLSAAARAKLKK
jgi:hypothetical protein